MLVLYQISYEYLNCILLYNTPLADIYDFSSMTLHQAKMEEMEAQVHILELQSELERERVRLSQLRKKHYQLAGEAEGWDEQVSKRGHH